ncbi:MAG: ABC transporter transmembrane domain-containing protein, partial [Planctomycetota bacterium]|nr:ABC transporter transmembrane domain-containing protein [Planctomycetota bacterium]
MIAPVDFDDPIEAQQINLGIWRRLWRYTKPYRKDVGYLVGSGVLVALVGIGFPLVTGAAIDDVAANGREARFWMHGSIYGVLIALTAFFVWAFIYFAGKIRTHVSHDIRRDGFATLQHLEFSFFDQRPVGWLMARMTSDCERLSNILAWGVLDLAWGATRLTAISLVMLWIDWKLAFVVLAVVPFLFWISAQFRRRILKTAREVRKTNSKITASYNEGIMGVRTTKVFRRERHNLGDFRSLSGQMYGASVRNALLSALYLPVILTLGSVATAGALVWGGYDVVAGGITVGTLVIFLQYAQQFFEPVQELAHWFAEMQMAQASAERILDLIDTEPAIQDSPEVRARIANHGTRAGLAPDGHPERLGRIEFKDVGFSYRQGVPVL